MKNLILPVVAVISLMTMSFTTNSIKFQTIKTETGTCLTNVDFLSSQDLNALEKMTIVGAKKTTLVNKTVKDNWVNETVYKTEDQEPAPGQLQKLDRILAKY